MSFAHSNTMKKEIKIVYFLNKISFFWISDKSRDQMKERKEKIHKPNWLQERV